MGFAAGMVDCSQQGDCGHRTNRENGHLAPAQLLLMLPNQSLFRDVLNKVSMRACSVHICKRHACVARMHVAQQLLSDMVPCGTPLQNSVSALAVEHCLCYWLMPSSWLSTLPRGSCAQLV